MVMENLRRKIRAPATGNEVPEQPRFESMRSRVVKATWLRRSRRIAKALGLGAALLIATAIGTADAQVSGSWQKVRQGCKPGQLTCRIKAKFTVQNFVSTTILRVYLSDDAVFDGADTLLITVDPIPSLGLVKMNMDLADPTVVATNDGLSASASFLIAVADAGTQLAVFAKPGPAGVVLFDKLFGPDAVTRNAGTRVRWMHRDDGQDHTVTGGSCDEFLHVFDAVGTFPYFCEKHEADMTGTIIVVP